MIHLKRRPTMPDCDATWYRGVALPVRFSSIQFSSGQLMNDKNQGLPTLGQRIESRQAAIMPSATAAAGSDVVFRGTAEMIQFHIVICAAQPCFPCCAATALAPWQMFA